MSFDFDLFVIGAGSGGVRAARMSAALGKKVAVAEEKYLGGTCVNVGCVPKKLLVYASHFAEDFTDAQGFGWKNIQAEHSWPDLIANKNKEIERLNGIYQNLLENAGVQIISGRAIIAGTNEVEIAGKIYTAEKILITVGCKPSLPSIPGIEYAITSDEAFYLEELPKRVAVIGGGYIAVEFAGIFEGLGSETHLVYRGDHLLRHFDKDIGEVVSREMMKKGIDIHFNANIVSIKKYPDGFHCLFANDEVLVVDQVMYATGREALTAKLGLENTRVQLRENGTIVVDQNFQTADSSIYALGDVIGTPELTPVALAQAMVFVDQQYGENKKVMSYDAIPTAIFCQPNVSTVGLSEQKLKEEGVSCDVYISEFRHLKHTLSGNEERFFMKLLVESSTDKVLGLHIVGPDAGELVQGFAVAIKAGLTKADFDSTIGIHPTAAEELVTMRNKSYSL